MKQSYRVLNEGGIWYPTDPKVVKRLLAGEAVPEEQRGLKHAPQGAVVDDVPQCSVGWLVEQREIEAAGGGEG